MSTTVKSDASCEPGRRVIEAARHAPALRQPGRRARCPVAIALMLSLAACVRYEPRPLHPADSARQFSARRLDAPELRTQVQALLPSATTSWPPSRWDRGSLLAVALAQNPRLAVARSEARVALAREVAAGVAPNPDLTLQSEYARDESHSWLYGIGFDVLLRSSRRRRLDVDIAKLAGANAQWNVVEQAWAVRRALNAALSEWQDASRRGVVLGHVVDSQARLAAMQERRIAAGEDAPGSGVAARAALLEAEQQRAQARSDAGAAQTAVAAALGLPPEALDGVQPDWPDWGAPPPVDDVLLRRAGEQALLSRADLAAAIGDYAGAEKQFERAVARQYPEFHLEPGYYWDHGIAKWPLDVAFALPIFNRNEGEIAEARAARDVAAGRMLALQAQIQGQIAAATRAEVVAAQGAAAAQRRVDAAAEQSRHAELGLKLGAIDRSERVAAEATAWRVQLDALQARARYQDARDALEDALHVPLSGPELALRPALQAAAPVDEPASSANEAQP